MKIYKMTRGDRSNDKKGKSRFDRQGDARRQTARKRVHQGRESGRGERLREEERDGERGGKSDISGKKQKRGTLPRTPAL